MLLPHMAGNSLQPLCRLSVDLAQLEKVPWAATQALQQCQLPQQCSTLSWRCCTLLLVDCSSPMLLQHCSLISNSSRCLIICSIVPSHWRSISRDFHHHLLPVVLLLLLLQE